MNKIAAGTGPSREGVQVAPFGRIAVPDKPRSWSKRRYLETFDEDRMTVWAIYPDGRRARFVVRGPLSARALISGLALGARHLVEWGDCHRPGPHRFPAELVARMRHGEGQM